MNKHKNLIDAKSSFYVNIFFFEGSMLNFWEPKNTMEKHIRKRRSSRVEITIVPVLIHTCYFFQTFLTSFITLYHPILQSLQKNISISQRKVPYSRFQLAQYSEFLNDVDIG